MLDCWLGRVSIGGGGRGSLVARIATSSHSWVGIVRVLVAIINIVKVPGVVEVVVGRECKASLTWPKQPGQGKRSQPG